MSISQTPHEAAIHFGWHVSSTWSEAGPDQVNLSLLRNLDNHEPIDRGHSWFSACVCIRAVCNHVVHVKGRNKWIAWHAVLCVYIPNDMQVSATSCLSLSRRRSIASTQRSLSPEHLILLPSSVVFFTVPHVLVLSSPFSVLHSPMLLHCHLCFAH